MSATSAITFSKSNRRGADLGTGNLKPGTITRLISDRLKAIFPRSTWTYVEKLLYPGQERERLVKHRLACSREYSLEELATLLRTDMGEAILDDLMGDARPRWYRVYLLMKKTADVRRQRELLANELQEAIDADTDLTAAIERADTALAFQVKDGGSARSDVRGPVASIPHFTVASAAQKGAAR